MAEKKKENYSGNADVSNDRDNFQTPRYATELLLPYIPSYIDNIWECAAGDGAIQRVLSENGYEVFSSDIRKRNGVTESNFLTDDCPFPISSDTLIITNPPFASTLKRAFYKRCVELSLPFALLIPADYAGWLIDAIRFKGCEKVIPTRRIDYITPFIEELVFKGEIKTLIETKLKKKFRKFSDIPTDVINEFSNLIPRYSEVRDIPENLIGKYSSSSFHSMWLTFGFGLGQSETFVELTNEMKKGIL